MAALGFVNARTLGTSLASVLAFPNVLGFRHRLRLPLDEKKRIHSRWRLKKNVANFMPISSHFFTEVCTPQADRSQPELRRLMVTEVDRYGVHRNRQPEFFFNGIIGHIRADRHGWIDSWEQATQLANYWREAFVQVTNSEALKRAELRQLRPARGPFDIGRHVFYFDAPDQTPAAGGTTFSDLRKQPLPEEEEEAAAPTGAAEQPPPVEDLSSDSLSMARMKYESDREQKRSLRSYDFFEQKRHVFKKYLLPSSMGWALAPRLQISDSSARSVGRRMLLPSTHCPLIWREAGLANQAVLGLVCSCCIGHVVFSGQLTAPYKLLDDAVPDCAVPLGLTKLCLQK